MLDRDVGLYRKFEVHRTDGRDAPGEKHAGCRYFVLDLEHDGLASTALTAYADAAERDGYGPLADDIRALVNAINGLHIANKKLARSRDDALAREDAHG